MTANDNHLSGSDEYKLWQMARDILASAHLDQKVSAKRIDRLTDALPRQNPGESLPERVRRASGRGESARLVSDTTGITTNVTSIETGRRLRPLAQIVRLAADSQGEMPQLPDPGQAIETSDGQFRLTIRSQDGGIALILSALGLASDLYAGKVVVIADADHRIVAELLLNEDGDGATVIEDSVEHRLALLRPVIGMIEDE